MDKVGLNVVEQALVVGDDEATRLWRYAVDAFGHDAERIDVQARIGFVQQRQCRLEQQHLKDFKSLFLATAEPVVDVAREHGFLHLKRPHGGVEFFAELSTLERLVPNRLHGFLEEGAQPELRG